MSENGLISNPVTQGEWCRPILSCIPILADLSIRIFLSKTGVSGRELVIEMQSISKIYLTDEVETHALSKVDLIIEAGDFVCVTGPSGCGKSTLLSIAGLLDTPTSGRYFLNGHALEDLSSKHRARIRNREIGFIFQNFNLIGDLTVYKNIELPLTYRHIPSSDRRERISEALARVGLSHRMKHYPGQLSGGEQQRVAVARALAGSPTILLADEPTGNLDSNNGEAVMRLLSELHDEGATICMVTHNPQFERYAQRSFQLLDGRVVGVPEPSLRGR